MRQPTDCLTCEYRTHRMFCNLAPHALVDFNSIGVLVLHPSGVKLIREGEPCRRILVICTGQVILSCTSSAGLNMNVRVALAGDVLGLGAAISNASSEVTAVTIEPTFVKIVPRSQFVAFLACHGEASLHAAQLLALEYKSSFEGARRLALSGSVAARLASLLLDWGRSDSCGRSEIVFTMTFSHEAIAGFVGTSRESITRALGSFQRKKLIYIRGSSVRILAEEKLAQLAC